MPNTSTRIRELFFKGDLSTLMVVIATILLMALAQLASVSLIMPFVSVVFYPESINQISYLSAAYELSGLPDTKSFTVACGVLVLSSLIFGNLFIALAKWQLARFTWRRQARLSEQLYRQYITLPYERFSTLNSADILKNTVFESSQVTTGVLMPLLNTVAFSVNALLIIGFLFWLSPVASATVAITLAGSYAVTYLLIQGRLSRNGKTQVWANSKRYKTVNEGFGSIKEVKVLQIESALVSRFSDFANQFAEANTSNAVLSQTPRYVVEAVAFSLFVAGLIYLVLSNQAAAQALPLASAFAVGGIRLLPAMQIVFQSVSAIRYNMPSLDKVYSVLQETTEQQQQTAAPAPANKRPLTQYIQLDKVSFRYSGADRDSLKNITLKIEHPSLVAFVGHTGAGKSTLADLLLGLLSPSSGRFCVDGQEVSAASLPQWREHIGYVPQEIYLADCSIAENIAFGLPPDQIDMNKVYKAAQKAHIHTFIEQQLPKGYNTITGERGVRLSGGQRQRIGIARALYRDPDVLVLDEATSALDTETERHVHQAITEVTQAKTVILIAHRLDTVKNCDQIYLLEQGEIIAQGKYTTLLNNSASFANLVAAQQHQPSANL